MRHFKKQLGITLLEVLVSVAIFAMVSVISILTIVQINNLQYYNRMQQELQDQGRLAMEFIGHKITAADRMSYVPASVPDPANPTSNINTDTLIVGFDQEEYASNGANYYVYKSGDDLVVWSKCRCRNSAVHTVISQTVHVEDLSVINHSDKTATIRLVLKPAPKEQLRLSSVHSPLLSLQNIDNLTYTLQTTFSLPSS